MRVVAPVIFPVCPSPISQQHVLLFLVEMNIFESPIVSLVHRSLLLTSVVEVLRAQTLKLEPTLSTGPIHQLGTLFLFK